MLHQRKGVVRAVDIANELEFSKPSVSVAMKNLREKGFIQVDETGNISLLPEGLRIARMVYEKHTLLTQCLIALGVPEQTAAEDACRIEHVLSKESFDAIKAHFGGRMDEEDA